MAKLEVLKFPDPVSVTRARPFGRDARAENAREDMLETMYSFKGIGLAAIQVAREVRLLVTDTRPRENGAGYNPEDMTELERAVPQPW